MEQSNENIETAKALYNAWSNSDRDAIESLLAPDFHFTSPLDNRLDRSGYFEYCWPNSGGGGEFEFVGFGTADDRVWVTYEGHQGAVGGRNTELITVRDGKVVDVEVYFGWTVPHDVPKGSHRDPA
ncbi:nuclear transport factor 2 family protein [Leifsonia sp. NPDC058230]|uniref:nuclear transport factor 2 family protein n=1 Tax=Leifsonia sp. NPDC058230 TaxID=3346391 RepID=UPI0036DC792F